MVLDQSGKVQAVVHTLEMGKYNEYLPMLDIVCAGKDVEGTYKEVKLLIDNVGIMHDFRKSGLYKHMKFRDIDEAILDSVKKNFLKDSEMRKNSATWQDVYIYQEASFMVSEVSFILHCIMEKVLVEQQLE